MTDEIKLDDLSSCYVCFEKTNNKSSCECEAEICENCFRKIILNNGKKCTICKKDYMIIDNEILQILEENRNISNTNRRRDMNEIIIENIKLLFCILILVLLTPIIGIIIRLLLDNKINHFLSIYNFIFGMLFWCIILLLINLISSIIKLLNCFLDYINDIMYNF